MGLPPIGRKPDLPALNNPVGARTILSIAALNREVVKRPPVLLPLQNFVAYETKFCIRLPYLARWLISLSMASALARSLGST